MYYFKEDSKTGIDLRDFTKKLPSASAGPDGKAPWMQAAEAKGFPRLVVGSELDYIVDEEGVQETAAFVSVTPQFLPTVPHDCMLGPPWTIGAEALLAWLEPSSSEAADEE